MNSRSLLVDGVTRSFGGTSALSNVSFTLQAGETALLLGHNGSGKSTLLSLCSGLLRPHNGTISRVGQTVPYVGYFGPKLMLYGDLTVHENLSFFGSLIGKSSVRDVLAAWSLDEYAHVRVQALSQGLRALTSLARAFLGDPDFLFLDEPSAFLDDESTNTVLQNIARRSEGVTFVATHDVARLGALSSRILLLREGSLLGDYFAAGRDEAISAYRGTNR